MTDFASLGLAEPIIRAVTRAGYTTPTPIQEQAIPALLDGHDLMGIAQTGTGKTAAFSLPILQHLAKNPPRGGQRGPRALIIAPTRELAAQIAENVRVYGANQKVSVAVVVGGVSPGPQIRALAGRLDVLVATPGRLLDHLKTGVATLAGAGILVLDEADHLLDLGFLPSIRRIIKYLPAARQTVMFSATMPPDIATLAADILKDPVQVSVSPVAKTADKVAQQVYLVEAARKRELLVNLLGQPEFTSTIVFTRTKRGADKVSDHLDAAGLGAAAIHGNKSQGQRERALSAFKTGKTRILVATDIAARGVDISGVSHVINFELPDVAESYVHRIGRTARAGKSGTAISFCDGEERHLLLAIEKLTRQRLPVVDHRQPRADGAPPAPEPRAEAPRRSKPGPRHRGGPRQDNRGRGEGRGAPKARRA